MDTTINLTCHGCKTEFSKNLSDYNRTLRDKPHCKNFYCSAKCAGKYMHRPNKKHIPVIKECLWCNTKFNTTTNPKDRKCCTLSCAKKYAVSKFRRTAAFRNKMAETSKAAWLRGDYPSINSGKRYFNSKGEIELRKFLQSALPDYNFTTGMVSNKLGLSVDIWSREKKVMVEYDGIWHFEDIKGQLKEKQRKDKLTETWCKKNGWRCIRIKETVYKKDVNG